MSCLIDTNIFVYSVNSDFSQYKKAYDFLQSHLKSEVKTYLCWPVIYEFLRVVTHPRIFSKPLKNKQAWDFIKSLLSLEHVGILTETSEHEKVLSLLLRKQKNLKGNLIHDCHIAALMNENGVKKIYTCDVHYRLFDFLKVIKPF